MRLKIKKLNSDAILPSYAHPGDAGLDLYALEEYSLSPQEIKSFSTGLAIELEANYVALIKDKSGLALKYGLHTLGGVIDAGYRGEIKVILINHGRQDYLIKVGDKIAQLLIVPVIQAEIKEVSKLSNSSRGKQGFGSSGR